MLGFIFLTGILGLAVGFIKGGLWLMCWVGAIFATLHGYPYIEPVATPWLAERGLITNALFAHLAIGSTIFLASLVVLFAVSSVVSGWVRESRVNALDRSLGFAAGLAVAVGIISALYIPVSASWTEAEEQPAWFREARLGPVIQWSSGLVRTILPERLGGDGALDQEGADHTAAADRAYRALADPRPEAGGSGAAAGYDSGARRDMDRLFETVRDR